MSETKSKEEIEYWKLKSEIEKAQWDQTKNMWLAEHTMKVEKHQWDKAIADVYLEKTTLELREQTRRLEMLEHQARMSGMGGPQQPVESEEEEAKEANSRHVR